MLRQPVHLDLRSECAAHQAAVLDILSIRVVGCRGRSHLDCCLRRRCRACRTRDSIDIVSSCRVVNGPRQHGSAHAEEAEQRGEAAKVHNRRIRPVSRHLACDAECVERPTEGGSESFGGRLDGDVHAVDGSSLVRIACAYIVDGGDGGRKAADVGHLESGIEHRHTNKRGPLKPRQRENRNGLHQARADDRPSNAKALDHARHRQRGEGEASTCGAG
eukprot:1991346-Prymnesium_polylepis.1